MIHHTKGFAFGKTLPQAEFTSAEEENIPKEKYTAPVWGLFGRQRKGRKTTEIIFVDIEQMV